jgi:hypothetical protein
LRVLKSPGSPGLFLLTGRSKQLSELSLLVRSQGREVIHDPFDESIEIVLGGPKCRDGRLGE